MADTKPTPPVVPTFQRVQIPNPQAAIAQLLSPQGVALKIYANGFGIVQTANDISIVFLANGAPSGTASFSYNVAKDLAAQLTRSVKEMEEVLGHEIKSTAEIDAGLQKIRKGK